METGRQPVISMTLFSFFPKVTHSKKHQKKKKKKKLQKSEKQMFGRLVINRISFALFAG